MAKTLFLEVVTPDRLVLQREVESVSAPGTAGDFCVLPLHMPLLSSLRVGSLGYRVAGRLYYVFVSGGFLEVAANRVLVLAEVSELPEEIDLERAKKARERALERLEAERRERVDQARALAALQRALARIKIHEEARLTGSFGRG